MNQSLVDLADETLKAKGHEVQIVHTEKEYNIDDELEKHQCDIVLLQTPMNWMTVTWSFKKYMDEVYTAGMQVIMVTVVIVKHQKLGYRYRWNYGRKNIYELP